MQNNKLLFVILIFLNIFLFLYGAITHLKINIGESVIYSLSKPFLQINKKFIDYGARVIEDLQTKQELKKEVIALRRENKELKEKINNLSYLRQENKELKDTLEFHENNFFKKITARVIGGSNSLYQNIIIINKGRNSNLKEGMGVVDYNGVVGVISRTYSTTSKVLLVTDPRFKLDVKLLLSNRHGILMGKNSFCEVKYLPSNKNYKKNELVVTSGLNNIFPYGIPVGTVKEIKEYSLYKAAVVTPFLKKYSVNFVQVIIK